MSEMHETPAQLSPEQRALIAVRRMKAKIEELERAQNEPIAIIGMNCRFPGGASDPERFWELLSQGRDGITEVPPERWDADAYYDPDVTAPGKMPSRWGGFVEQVDQFDAAFFGITPREAQYMDPQQRLLLEVAWEALERTGQTTNQLAGSSTGVFMAICNNDYSTLFQSVDPSQFNAYLATGNAHSIVANRLSYFLDLRGPSIAIDTACSSSLVALHLACQSLRQGECQMALVGGVNLILSPYSTMALAKAHMLAGDGRCKTFDSLADGFVRGEGCGMVILKRLSQAQVDGDEILAVVRGSAVNQDGRSNGLTAPNMQAQQAVLRQALRQAGVRPEEVAYIETHGTGTPLGDPIEVEAITAVYGGQRSDSGLPCALGAVKTNIGHLEGAAGIAGVIKAVLALQQGAIPPNLHFQHLNPNIAFERTPFFVPTHLTPWPEAKSRLVGISSFGFGGTNAHLILEQAPPSPATESPQSGAEEQEVLVPLSARQPQAVLDLVRAILRKMEQCPDVSVRDLSYSLAVRREHYQARAFAVVRDRVEFVAALQGLLDPQAAWQPVVSRERGKLIWVFAGQGTQWAGMARQMEQRWPLMRQHLERCDQLITTIVGWSLRDVLWGEQSAARLRETAVVQPVLVAVQTALAVLWRSWDIQPKAVVGHSVGEISAACVAGVLTLEEALRLACWRGACMQEGEEQGAMLAVQLHSSEQRLYVQEVLARVADGRVEIAAENSLLDIVLSGEATLMGIVEAQLVGKVQRMSWVEVAYGFHSPLMEEPARRLRQQLEARPIQGRPEQIPLLSTVTGGWLSGEQMNAQYWQRNVRETVRFSTAITRLLHWGGEGSQVVFLEVGVHPALSGSIQRCAQQHGLEVEVLTSGRRGQGEVRPILRSLGRLYMLGWQPQWQALFPSGERVSLPTYPWQRQRFWVTASNPIQKTEPVPGPGKEVASSEEPFGIDLTTVPVAMRQKLLEDAISRDVALVIELSANIEPERGMPFSQMGFDSLMMLEVKSRIEKHIRYKFPHSLLELDSTIESLAVALAPLMVAAPMDLPASVVPLHQNEAAQASVPCFCLPGILGTVSVLNELAQELGQERSVYALQSPGIEEGQEPFYRVEDLALFYRKAIAQVQPEGPYHLIGWSFGGVVAFEMAHQLRQQGQQVTLTMIDTQALAPREAIMESEEEQGCFAVEVVNFLAFSLGKQQRLRYEEIASLAMDEQEEAVISHLHALGNTWRERRSLDQMYQMCRANLLALQRYTPLIYDDSLLFFEATTEIEAGKGFSFSEDASSFWRAYCSGGLRCERIAGNHFTIMQEPSVHQIAEHIQRSLNDLLNGL